MRIVGIVGIVGVATLAGCNSGQFVVDLLDSECDPGADCTSSTCDGAACGATQEERESAGDGETRVEERPTGDPCTSGSNCASGRCQSFDGAQICTEACTSGCPNALVCFGGECVPPGFCEKANGQGRGPGCAGSPCENCGSGEQCQARFVGGFECGCKDGFVRKNGTCEADPCSSNPCQNSGFCQTVVGVAGPVCSCADDDGDGNADYAGSLCEIPIERCPTRASANPCQNSGTCVDRPTGFSCACRDGFTGETCEVDVDECESDPCERGECEDADGSFVCTCPEGFTGSRCQIENSSVDCAVQNPCENGGLCLDRGASVACDCSAVDFEGEFCTQPLDDCLRANCQNGSNCVDGLKAYTCANCPLGFGGQDCDEAATCADEWDCAPDQFCDDGTCAPDVCDPRAARSCSGQAVQACTPDGGAKYTLFTCTTRYTEDGQIAFNSTCQDPAENTALIPGDAFCTCEDDWDCPANTQCDVDRCVGTGRAPECRLEPEAFSNVLPENEIRWGGVPQSADLDLVSVKQRHANDAAVGSPFPEFSQVVATPVVANLDDDNGDGKVDERDFPEIIFTTFCDSNYRGKGTLRAIHGGGTDANGESLKGRDYFAVCNDDTHWLEGDPLSVNCECDRAVHEPTSIPAVADLNGDGFPEIVVVHENLKRLIIYNRRGQKLSESKDIESSGRWKNPGVTIADMNRDGIPEIIVGADVFTLKRVNRDILNLETGQMENQAVPEIDRHLKGGGQNGYQNQGPLSCVADVLGSGDLELIAGGSIYQLPASGKALIEVDQLRRGKKVVAGFCAIADVLGNGTNPGRAQPLDGVPEIILVSGGQVLIYQRGADGFGEQPALGINPGLGSRGGAPNVDDFDGDGFPEIGTAFARGYGVIDLQPEKPGACDAWPDLVPSTTRWQAPGIEVDSNARPISSQSLNSGRLRSPPLERCSNDDDCGGAASGFACNEELGQCVCEHNSWLRGTQDNSSQVTGSSVFDFNGDGAAEVVYNDECYFRIYDGLTGNVLFVEPSESRTRVEYPVIADADNDGNAEILFAVSNESNYCESESNETTRLNTEPGLGPISYNNGLEMWGDASDTWVAARRIWNQHSYHITNITENASVPRYEPKGWRPQDSNGRDYNSYRSNPRNFGVAPDLQVARVQVVGDATGCNSAAGSSGQIIVEVANRGDLRVGPGVAVGLQADFGGAWQILFDAAGRPLIATIENTLEPQDTVFLTLPYDAAWNGQNVLPMSIRATADVSFDARSGQIAFDDGAERECDETNNTRETLVNQSAAGVDLVVESVRTDSCLGTSTPNVKVRVGNVGTLNAAGALVQIFAGNPNQGGTVIGEARISAGLPGGASTLVDIKASRFPACSPVQVFALVDPANEIEECNDGNNLNRNPSPTICLCSQGG